MTDNLDQLNAYVSPPFERINVNSAWIDAAADEVAQNVFNVKGYSPMQVSMVADIIRKHMQRHREEEWRNAMSKSPAANNRIYGHTDD